MLSTQSINTLQENQNKLDNFLRKKLDISPTDWFNLHYEQEIALGVEVAEFVNEAREWKYWKLKDIDRERLLDECVDVVHFFIQNTIREGKSPEQVNERLNAHVDSVEKTYSPIHPKFARLDALRADTPFLQMALVLYMTAGYGFTEDDIMKQYHLKNNVNIQRAEEGY